MSKIFSYDTISKILFFVYIVIQSMVLSVSQDKHFWACFIRFQIVVYFVFNLDY